MISATLMGEELAVIDDELILKCAASERKALEAEKPHHGDFAEVEQEEISISKLTSLTLSFQNLRVIENLLTLDRLRVLRLDNNRIEAITGLAHLTALEWLVRPTSSRACHYLLLRHCCATAPDDTASGGARLTD